MLYKTNLEKILKNKIHANCTVIPNVVQNIVRKTLRIVFINIGTSSNN